MLSAMPLRHIRQSYTIDCGTNHKLQIVDNQWTVHCH